MNPKAPVPAPSETQRWVGARVLRKEDPRFLTGRGVYVADISRRSVLHAAFTRSSHAAADITRTDLTAARGLPGVMGAFDADALKLPGIVAAFDRPGFTPTTMPILARERVRFVGEPIAVILAADPYTAEDATELVDVDYSPLPPLMSVTSAQSDQAAAIHVGLTSNVFVNEVMFGDDTQSVLSEADIIVRGTFSSARVHAMPLETRGCLCEWNERDSQLIVHISTQVPHYVRKAIASTLDIPERAIRVIAPDVGGGFGVKCAIGREELTVAALAHRLRRPVKWIEDRSEQLMGSFHGHEQLYDVQAGFNADGKLLGMQADIVCDVGAYSAYPFTCGIEPFMAGTELPGVYRLPAYRVHVRAVATNKPPIAPYRGVSRPQIVLVMERLMDKAAQKLGLDYADIRRRNLIRADDFPYEGVNGITYDAGSYEESLDLCVVALERGNWYSYRDNSRAEGRLVGIGLSCFSERTGYGTPYYKSRHMAETPGYDISQARMDPSGTVRITTGACGHGQGHQTTFAQIAADELGLRPDEVTIVEGDTDVVAQGWGTFGSRSGVIGGSAIKRASAGLADRVREIAAHLMEASPSDIQIRDGIAAVRGVPGMAITLAEVSRIAHYESYRLPPHMEPGMEASGSYDPPGTFSNAVHAAIVEIDPGSGDIAVRHFIVVEDVGTLINPMVVEGQVRGGVAHGVGNALMSRLVYDADGQPQSTSLLEYRTPTADVMPSVELHHLSTPSEHSATGAKGAGEGGAIGSPAAIVNAVNDALSHTGVQFDSIPILPEQVISALSDVPERV